MLEELRRCNSIGNKTGLEFLINMILGKDFISIDEVKRLSTFRTDIKLKCDAAVAFLSYLELVDIVDGNVLLTDIGKELFVLDSKVLHKKLCICIIEKMIDEGIFDNDAFRFDEQSCATLLKRWVIPLSYAALRNYLIENEALRLTESGELEIENIIAQTFKIKISQRRRKISLEQLLKIKESQNLQGSKAEEFILKYEKKRLIDHPYNDKIQRISDFDVCAGYDIVSYLSTEDMRYNRFIEVKSYQGESHFFWSDNEVDVARLKGSSYYLCLVDMEKIDEPGYEPMFIENPIETVFEGNQWLVDTSVYQIKAV
jgi:hypothetical protein